MFCMIELQQYGLLKNIMPFKAVLSMPLKKYVREICQKEMYLSIISELLCLDKDCK